MSQRQKKKASQSKKRYHDSKSKAEKQQHPKQEAQKPKAVETAPKQAHDKTKDESQASSSLPGSDHAHKSFSKRKITSNWERYSGGHEDTRGAAVESDEELQRRLIQLLNLPSATPRSLEAEPDTSTETQPKVSFLKLDCAALAQALSTLPLHRRLDLSPELWEEEEEGSSDLAANRHSQLSGLFTASQATPELLTIDLSSCKPNASPKPFDFALSTHLQAESLSRLGQDNDPPPSALITKPVEPTPPANNREGVPGSSATASDGVKREEDDKTLDLLLASDQTSLVAATHSTNSKKPSQAPIDSPTGTGTDTQALDDMLDELLA